MFFQRGCSCTLIPEGSRYDNRLTTYQFIKLINQSVYPYHIKILWISGVQLCIWVGIGVEDLYSYFVYKQLLILLIWLEHLNKPKYLQSSISLTLKRPNVFEYIVSASRCSAHSPHKPAKTMGPVIEC